jgi:HlyD family secretion protein
MNETTGKSSEIVRKLGLEGGRSRGWGRAGLVLAALAVAAIAWGVAMWSGSTTDMRYLTAEVARGGLRVTVSATGTVEPTNLVEISSELSGRLASVEVDFNDEVEVGSVLARLDTSKLEAQVAIARASLDAAIARIAVMRAALEEAREKFETARDLEARGILPHQDYITRSTTFARVQAELQSAQAERALAEANLDLYITDLGKACICSPIRGVVLLRAVDPGQIVAASLQAPVLFTVAEDLRQMELQVNIDEADIGRVAVGNTAEFTVDAYDERRFPAEIREVRLAPETIDGVVTYRAILAIDNSDLALRPGMTATADIVVAEIDDALIVPNAALRFAPPAEAEERAQERSGLLGMLMPKRPDRTAEGDSRTVWVLREGAATEVAVRTGDTDGHVTEIREGQLAPGDRVITGQQGG